MPLPAPPSRTPLAKVTSVQELFDHPDFRRRIAEGIPKHMDTDSMFTTFRVAVQRTPKLMNCTPVSLLGAFVTCSFLGLEPNTPLNHAYLIPFEVTKWNAATRQRDYVRTDVQLIVGYQGLLDLVMRGDRVESVSSNVVWAGDEFSAEYGSKQHLRHVPGRDMSLRQEMPDLAYMYARMRNNSEQFEIVTLGDVLATRDRSQAYQQALRAREEAVRYNRSPDTARGYIDAPWVAHFPAMMRKTAIRQGTKYLPRNPHLALAQQVEDTSESHRVRFDRVGDGKDFLAGAWLPDEGDVIEQDEQQPPDSGPPGRVTHVAMGGNTQQQSPPPPPPPPPTQQEPPPPPPQTKPATTRTSTRKKAAAEPPPTTTTGDPGAPPDDRWGDVQAPGWMTEPEKPPAPPPPPSFSHTVWDSAGEATGEPMTSPEGYARQVVFVASVTPSDDAEAFMRANEAGIAAARNASDGAAATLDAIIFDEGHATDEDPQDGGPPPDMHPMVTVADVRGAPDWPGFNQAIDEAAKNLTAFNFLAFVEHHIELIRPALSSERMRFVSILSGHATRLGIGVPPILRSVMPVANPTPPPPAPPPGAEPSSPPENDIRGRAEGRVRDAITLLDAMTLEHEVRRWPGQPLVVATGKGLVADNFTDLLEQMESAYKNALARVTKR